MEIDHPETRAEVTEVFHRYERALLANDNAQLLGLFLPHDSTLRYGVADRQHGFAEIAAFRARQVPFERSLIDTVITTYGRDFAVASTLFVRPDSPGQLGRQTQVWVRGPAGWQIGAAHVSMIDMADERTRPASGSISPA